MKKSEPVKGFAIESFWALAGVAFFLFLFYPALFLAREASLAGDHWEQHFPWATLLSESIRHFQLPFWTSLIHSGFPIAAEGQIGIFYFPNLLLAFLLPIRWAYSYANVLHFLLSGWSTYLYARQMKLRILPASVAAFVFLFGTSYGGAFYNMTSLKTIAWFPLGLWLFEKFHVTGKSRYLTFLSVVISQSVVAGYLQVAVFTWLIFLIYAAFRIFLFPDASAKERKGEQALKFGLCLIAAGLLTLPQLLLTFDLALQSNRINLSEDYAYVGSLSPLAVLTLIFPTFQGFLRGNTLYSGILPLLFVFIACFSQETRRTPLFRLWALCGAIAFLLALGEWSPLYVALVKLTHFYSFRVPAKFLVFICFGIALLCGAGLQAWLVSSAQRKAFERALRLYQRVLWMAVICYGLLYSVLRWQRDIAIRIGEWFVSHFIHGRMGHPHSLEVYFERLRASLSSIESLLSFRNPWNLWVWALIVIGAFVATLLIQQRDKAKRWLMVAGLVTFFDLYIFSWADIKKDFGSYKDVLAANPMIEQLKREHSEGKVGRIYGFRKDGENLPLIPSANMLYGLEDIGAYSPFVLSRYYETIGLFGSVNDSNRAMVPTSEFALERLALLNALDVTHILSTQALEHEDLELLLEDPLSKTWLYHLKAETGRAFFVSPLQVLPDWPALRSFLMIRGFDPRKMLLLEEAEAKKIKLSSSEIASAASQPRNDPERNTKGAVIAPQGLPRSFKRKMMEGVARRPQADEAISKWSVEVHQPGFFVLMNTHYSGWRAQVNGKRVPLLKAYGLFQCVRLEKPGSFDIEFHYSPFSRD